MRDELNPLSDYEKAQIRSIQECKRQEPSVVSKTVGKLFTPLVWLINKLIPQSAMRGATTGTVSVVGNGVDVSLSPPTVGPNSTVQLTVKNTGQSQDTFVCVAKWNFLLVCLARQISCKGVDR